MDSRELTHGRPRAPDGWLQRDEVAAMVGIHKQNVLRWERQGKIPMGKMFGNVRVWRRDVIERFLVTLEVEPENAV